MRTFNATKAFCTEALEAVNYPDIGIYPGPNLQDDDPNTYVVLTRYGGAGLEVDGIIDSFGWQIRVVGGQFEYDIAEGVADALDLAWISHQSGDIGDLWVVEINRVGGPPAVLMVDDGDRTHFACSYLASVESALA